MLFAHHRLGWARAPLLGFGSLLGLGLLSTTPVLADCSDPPAPKVDWRSCTMHQRDFADSVLTKAKLKDGRFMRSDFTGGDLGGIDGRRAKFIDAVLVRTPFYAAPTSPARGSAGPIWPAPIFPAPLGSTARRSAPRALSANASAADGRPAKADLEHDRIML